MSCRRSNVTRLGPLDPAFVRYPGSDAAASSTKYIVCMNGRVPERYEVWSLNAHGVCEVHLTARVKLFDLFVKIFLVEMMFEVLSAMTSAKRINSTLPLTDL